MATTKHPAGLSEFVSKQITENARKAVGERTEVSKEKEELENDLDNSKDSSMTVIGENQKDFKDVFGFDPSVPEGIPVTCYKPEDWDEKIRFLIPEADDTYEWPREELEDLVIGMEIGDNVWLSGPTGSGKSSLIQEYCARVGRPFVRFNGREDVEADAFFGRVQAENGSTVWHDGDFTTAFKYGALVLVDEATVIPAGIMMGLQWTLEPNGKLLLVDKAGSTEDRIVKPNERFRAVYADNTRGLGDFTGAHAGTGVLNTAQLDRFGTSIHLDYLPQEREVAMLQKKFPNIKESVLKNMVKFAELIRRSYRDGELSLTTSPRALQNILSKLSYHGNVIRAVQASYLNKLEDDAEIDAARRHFKTVFDKQI